jgi:flagellar basal-body rod protein FlgC
MAGLEQSMGIAASGMKAQSERLRVVAQNIANSDSISMQPNGEPYRRKTIFFENVLNKELGAEVVKVKKIDRDKAEFPLIYDPNHPAANNEGYVARPNVDRMIEMEDMKEAQRSYEANVATIEVTKSMIARTLDLMR